MAHAPVAEAAARAEAEGEEGKGVLHGVGPGLGGVGEEALGAEGLRVGPVLRLEVKRLGGSRQMIGWVGGLLVHGVCVCAVDAY